MSGFKRLLVTRTNDQLNAYKLKLVKNAHQQRHELLMKTGTHKNNQQQKSFQTKKLRKYITVNTANSCQSDHRERNLLCNRNMHMLKWFVSAATYT